MPGLLRGVARTAAVVGTATAVSGNVQRRQNQKYAQQDTQAVPAQAAPAQPTEADQLEQLAQLKQQGVITEEEFAAKKKQILGI